MKRILLCVVLSALASGCAVEQNDTEQKYCAAVEQAEKGLNDDLWKCMTGNTARLTDKTTPAGDIATAVIYRCNTYITALSDATIGSVSCQEARKYDRSVSFFRNALLPKKDAYVESLSENVRGEVVNQVLQNRSGHQ